MVTEFLQRISIHSVVLTKGCYQCKQSILSTVRHIYIVSFKARIDEHGRHRENVVVKSESSFVRDLFTVHIHEV